MDAVKAKVQEEALARWEQAGRRGLLAMGTGTGKSRIPLIRLEELYEEYGENLRVLLAVYTEESRDVTWLKEAEKWNVDRIYNTCVTGVCYASLAKKPEGHYHFVILDEAHHLTELNSEFLKNITYDEIMSLTATEPEKGSEKAHLLASITPTVFKYSIDDGIKDGISADYEVFVVELPLNDTAKVVPGGNKKNRFMTTEKRAYEYMNRTFIKMLMSDNPNKDTIVSSILRRRAKFITGLLSKEVMGGKLIEKLSPGKKTLVFGGSIAQIEKLLPGKTYHSKSSREALDKFMNGELNILGAVNALNESVNIPELDLIIAVQLNSKTQDLIQRLGRALRKRPGHKAQLFILMVTGTEDEKWVNSALKGIDASKIVYTSYKNFL